jgi:hypothetical protein
MSTRPIIGITGRAGAGKDTLARAIADELGDLEITSTIRPLADPLKRIAGDVFGFTQKQLYGPSEQRNQPDPRWTRDDGRGPLTPREALQTLGTEWGRALHPDVWIRMLIREHASHKSGGVSIVPDVRFDNEARAIREYGGFVLAIVRPGDASALTGAAATHASEAGVSADLIHHTIVNDRGVDDLALEAGAFVGRYRRRFA